MARNGLPDVTFIRPVCWVVKTIASCQWLDLASRVGHGQGLSKHRGALAIEACYRHDNSRGVTDFTRGRARSSLIVSGGVGVSVSRKMTFLPPSFS
jgi:hypothetical protein